MAVLKLAATVMMAVTLMMGAATGEASAGLLSPREDPELESQIRNYLDSLDAIYGVAAISLDDGRAAFVNADEAFPTASLYKLLVMYRVLEAVDRGDLAMGTELTVLTADVTQEDSTSLSPGDVVTVSDALDCMVTLSSNTAAWVLTRAVGGWGVVSSAANDLGMSSTYLAGEDYWSTPSDIAHFLRLLANRALVSQWASDQMIDLLLRQTSNDRLPAYLPDSAQVAHKTGELEGVRNDAGIVRGPGGRYVIVVMSRGGDPAEQVPAEARISRMVYDRYGS